MKVVDVCKKSIFSACARKESCITHLLLLKASNLSITPRLSVSKSLLASKLLVLSSSVQKINERQR